MGLYIILMGVQGAGKGEQAKLITARYGIPQLSTGDLFRAMKTRTDEFAQKIQAILASGALVDDQTTCAVVEERLNQPDAAGGVIFDGFPRTPAQADWLADYLARRGEKVTAVILLELDLYVAFKRAFGRVSDAAGRTYNIFYNADGIAEWKFEDHPEKAYPPRLVAYDREGALLERRPDDANAGAIIKRIDTFVRETQPLIAYYRARGMLTVVNAEQAIAEVNAQINAVIDAARSA
jgi:adenylate kinase